MSSRKKYVPGAMVIDGHVQGLAIVRALGEKGIPVIVTDNYNCIARYSKYCKKYYHSPDYQSKEFINFLIDLAIKENLKDWILYPTNDHIVVNISKNKNVLEKYYKIITPDYEIIDKIYDKSNLLELATDNNIPVPKTYYPVDTELGDFTLNFPVLIKGKEGLSFYKMFGKKVFKINNLEGLRNQLKEIAEKKSLKDLFIQELIPNSNANKTISFATFSLHGEIKSYWMGMKLREHPLEFGTATYCSSIYLKELIEPSKKLVKALNYTGVCEIEFLKDTRDQLFKLIEINARTWLWVGLAKRCGINFPMMIYNYLNKNNNDYPTSYSTKYYWINCWSDTFYSMKAILTRKLKLITYLKSLFNKKQFAVLSFNDFKPFIALTLMLFYLAKRR